MNDILSDNLIKKFIPSRKINSRKGDNGVVLVIGGSYIYHGAPLLSSLAAIKAGADLVYTAVPKIIVDPIRSYSPNLI
ncbi:MAG: NAD(P)H-hydrate dehydratase, partial [Nitrosopumilaceae archaeon]|nr:NAD(P)H-hydrate dehydratase [Nitrosopumilaceae archaeon]